MATTQAVIPAKRKGLAIAFKVILIAGLLLAGVLLLAHVLWKASGNNQWVLEMDKNGVQVYSRKTAGQTLKDFKAVTHVKASLNRIVAAMNDNSTQNCKDWMPICAGLRPLVLWNPEQHYSITYFRLDLPRPYSPRDLVYKTQVWQDPQSKAVTVDLLALPGMVAEDSCCVRVTNIHNVWVWTPLKDGEVELVLSSSMDARVPYFLANQRGGDLYKLLARLPILLNKEQYRDQVADYIQEPAS